MPVQSGKVVVITGANSGLGFETASALAEKGAAVVLAVRSEEKGIQAADLIKSAHTRANVRVMQLDLSELASIKKFAEDFQRNYDGLSILINNAGIMIPPFRMTKDGFESQFGSNHLGHFALTGLLLPRLLATPGSRVVTLSSIAARSGKIDFSNLDGSKGYSAMRFYGQSKLANLLFAKELQNKFNAHGTDSLSVACHPGLSHTNLLSRNSGKQASGLMRLLSRLVSQPASMGSLPTLYAATEPALKGGEYIGPDGSGGRKGYPAPDRYGDKLYDPQVSEKLWNVSEALTGIRYPFD
jgi:NAD(P)-dependent dehydrogenase (short-subunit alcohol dehydrogenase family)